MWQKMDIPRSWKTWIPPQCSPQPSGDAHLVNSLVTGVLQPQVNHRVLQRPPHVEFQGEVINPLQEKTTPWSLSPGLEEGSPGLQKLLLGDISKTNRGKNAAQGGLQQEFQGCGSWVVLPHSPALSQTWKKLFDLDNPCPRVGDSSRMVTPRHPGGSTKLNFKKGAVS